MKRKTATAIFLGIILSISLIPLIISEVSAQNPNQSFQGTPVLNPLNVRRKKVVKPQPPAPSVLEQIQRPIPVLGQAVCTQEPSCKGPNHFVSDDPCGGSRPPHIAADGCYKCQLRDEIRRRSVCANDWSERGGVIPVISFENNLFTCFSQCWHGAPLANPQDPFSGKDLAWLNEHCPKAEMLEAPCPEGFKFEPFPEINPQGEIGDPYAPWGYACVFPGVDDWRSHVCGLCNDASLMREVPWHPNLAYMFEKTINLGRDGPTSTFCGPPAN